MDDDIFGSILDIDLSGPAIDPNFDYVFEMPEASLVGNILEIDMHKAHITEDPLIKNFEGNHHILAHDLTLRRVRFTLKVKHFVGKLFGRRPKKPILHHGLRRRISKRRL